MNKSGFWRVFAVFVLAGVMVAACGGGWAGEEAPVTSSGFECPAPEPKVEVASTELNMFVWTEYIPQDIIECFQLVYGVTINRDEFSSAEEMFSKLSKGGAGYDVAHVSDNVVVPSVRLGLLAELDHDRLPVISHFNPQYMNLPFDPGNVYTLPYEAGTDAIIYNTETVSDPPKSWADLWNPEYDGRIVSIEDSRAIIGMTLLTLGYDVNTTDEAQLEEAKAKLTGLMPNIKVFDSDSPKSPLLAGDVDLGIIWTGEAVLVQQENPAFEYIYPEEGAILWQDNWAIAAGAPHEDAAYAWLNYSMQPNLFWMMLRDFPYINPNDATLEYAKDNQKELYDAYMASSVTNVPPEASANGHFIVDVGDALPLFDRIWTEVKGQ